MQVLVRAVTALSSVGCIVIMNSTKHSAFTTKTSTLKASLMEIPMHILVCGTAMVSPLQPFGLACASRH